MGMTRRASRANVELHIEELVLEGFPAGDRHRITESLQTELARLLAENGVPPSLSADGEVAHLDGGEFVVAPGSKAQVIGGRVADAVYGGLRR